MNFSAAIQAHSNWKLRLANACMVSSLEKVDAGTLEKDNACELGKWLHGGTCPCASDPRFNDLIAAHAAFHRTAAVIARMVGLGKQTEAKALIDSRESEFCKLSVQVVGLLMGFRTRYGDA